MPEFSLLQRSALRKQLRARRQNLSEIQQRQAARNLYKNLAQQPMFQRARRIAVYLANDGEISPQELMQTAMEQGRQVYVPVLAPWPHHAMVLQRVSEQTCWEANRFGIQQPKWDTAEQAFVWSLDMLCMPLVGFDAEGGRLGMGGGFYDRMLAPLLEHSAMRRPYLVGLAHACQQVEHIPAQQWDVPLDLVATDTDIIYCSTILE